MASSPKKSIESTTKAKDLSPDQTLGLVSLSLMQKLSQKDPSFSWLIEDNKDLRNKDIFTLPAVSIERKSMNKDPNMKGVAWSHIPRINDAKGGAITVARRIKQDKTSNFANATAKKASIKNAERSRLI